MRKRKNFKLSKDSPQHRSYEETTTVDFLGDFKKERTTMSEKFWSLFDGTPQFQGWQHTSLRQDFKIFEEVGKIDYSDYFSPGLVYAGLCIDFIQGFYAITQSEKSIFTLVYIGLTIIFQIIIIIKTKKKIQDSKVLKILYLFLVLSSNNVTQNNLSPEELMICNTYSICWLLYFSEDLSEFFIQYFLILASNIVSLIFNNLKRVEFIILHFLIYFPSFITILKKSMKCSQIFNKFKMKKQKEFDDQRTRFDQIIKNLIVFKVTKSNVVQQQSKLESLAKKFTYNLEIMEISQNLIKRLIDQTKYLKKFKNSKKDLNESKLQEAKYELRICNESVKKVRKPEFLQDKIYLPYLISNNTILQYEKKHQVKMSLSQILIDQYELNKGSNLIYKNSVLYFRVPKAKLVEEEEPLLGTCSSQSLSSQSRDNETQNEEEKQMNQLHMDEDSLYYELDFEILSQNINEEQTILLHIRDITQIVRSQQKLSDKMYQDAIEANYSHEQMTPLNSILANSKIVIKRVEDLIEFHEEYQTSTNKAQNQETIMLLKSIKFSGKIMWYYNKNQITKMKINKQEFQSQYSITKIPEEFIKQVLKPFSPMIKRRELNVHIIRSNDFEGSNLRADWKSFQLSIFNLIQNGVKYNKYRGDLIFILSLTPILQFFKTENYDRKQTMDFFKIQQNDDFTKINPNYVLDIEIIDSGEGIEKEQQKYLFIPFLELKIKQDMKNVKNNSIGMGLTCSKMIMRQLRGKLDLLESQRGRTVFKLQMPVEKQDIILEEISVNHSQKSDKNHMVLFNYKRPLQSQILEYVMPKVDLEPTHMRKIAQQTIEMDSKFEDPQKNNQLNTQKNDQRCEERSLSNDTYNSKSESSLILRVQSNQELSVPKIHKVSKHPKNLLITEQERKKANRKISTANTPIRGLYGKKIKLNMSRSNITKAQGRTLKLKDDKKQEIDVESSVTNSENYTYTDSIFGDPTGQDVNEQPREQIHPKIPLMLHSDGMMRLSSQEQSDVEGPQNNSQQAKTGKVDSLIGFKPVNRLNKFVQKRIGSVVMSNQNLDDSPLSSNATPHPVKKTRTRTPSKTPKNGGSDADVSQHFSHAVNKKQLSLKNGLNLKLNLADNGPKSYRNEAEIYSPFTKKSRSKKPKINSSSMLSDEMNLSESRNSVSQNSSQVFNFKNKLNAREGQSQGTDPEQILHQEIQILHSKKKVKKFTFKKTGTEESKENFPLIFNLEGREKRPVIYRYLQNQKKYIKPLDLEDQSSKTIYDVDLDLESSGRLSFQIDMIVDRESSDSDSPQEDLRMPKARKKQLDLERQALQINSKNLRMFPICQQISYNIQRKQKASENYLVKPEQVLEEVKNSEYEIDATQKSEMLANLQSKSQSRMTIRDTSKPNESSSMIRRLNIQERDDLSERNQQFLQLQSPMINENADGGYLRSVKQKSQVIQSSEVQGKGFSPPGKNSRVVNNLLKKSRDLIISDSCLDLSAILQNAKEMTPYKGRIPDDQSLSDEELDSSFDQELQDRCYKDDDSLASSGDQNNYAVQYKIEEIKEDIREDDISKANGASQHFIMDSFGNSIQNMTGKRSPHNKTFKQSKIIEKQLQALGDSRDESKSSSQGIIDNTKLKANMSQKNIKPPIIRQQSSTAKSKSQTNVAHKFSKNSLNRKGFIQVEDGIKSQRGLKSPVRGQIQSSLDDRSQRNSLQSRIKSSSQISVRNKCNCEPKILAVDDNDFNLMPLQILVNHLFQIKTDLAFDGEQALEMFKESFQQPCQCPNRSYKFIFMDLQMPVMDGYDSSEKIIQLMRDANQEDYCHIVALTSYTSKEVRERVLQIGLKDLINKPLHSNDLQRMVYTHFYRVTEQEFQTKFPQLVSRQQPK